MKQSGAPTPQTCARCAHFRNDASYLEGAFAGLAIMGSGRSAVRAGDGLCRHHSLYLPAAAGCDAHEARRPGPGGANPAPA